MADLSSLYADRASLGTTDTQVPTSPLRLGALAAASVGAARLAIDAAGNVTAGVLAAGDIPPVFTRRDVAEIIDASWTWASGQTIGFALGPLAAPAATSRSLGTRLIIEPVVASTEYAIGRVGLDLWQSTPITGSHSWYTGATRRLHLDANGTLMVENGTGGILLTAAGTGDGALVAASSLQIRAFAGGITLQTGEGRIVPTLGYRENLGELQRKYLTLHAAELWVESLVAQDTLATIGGRVLVGPTSTLTRDAAPSDTTIYTKHNAFSLYVGGTEYGSKLVLQAAGKFEVLRVVTSITPTVTAQGDYAWVVERNDDGSGANQWYAGDAIFDTGKVTTGPGGFIDLYSVNGLRAGTSAGPTIVGNVRTGHGATDWREHWAVGNLQGLFGNAARKMGAAFGDANGMFLQVDATDGIRMVKGGVVTGQWSMDGIITLGESAKSQITINPVDGSLRMLYAGAEKISIRSDGTARLNAGLVVGSQAGSIGFIRSSGATAWNAGSGFFFQYTQATNETVALIGDSAGKRLQWTGTDLKIYSAGFTLDQNGIVLGQDAAGAYDSSKSISWGTTGGHMWDTTVGAGPRFELSRVSGQIRIEATASGGTGIDLQAGGSGVDRVNLQLKSVFGGPSEMTLAGTAGGGPFPRFVPVSTGVCDLGKGGATDPRRWRYVFAHNLLLGGTSAAAPAYELQLMNDSAYKPVTSTWGITPSDRGAKDEIVPVDPTAALALVRRVPLIRFRYTGALGSPAGVRGIGVVAQDLAPILPDSVATAADGSLSWNAHELLMLNVAAVQALAARLDTLERTPDR